MPDPVPEDPRLRLALDDGRLVLAQQRDDLERLRTRAVALLSAASVAAGLLGGFVGDAAPSRGAWFYAGLVFLGIMAAAVCVILSPHRTIFDNDPRVILTGYVDPGIDHNTTLRWLAQYAGDNADRNKQRLELLAWVYLAAVVCLGALVACLTLSLVTGGTSGRTTTPAVTPTAAP